MRLLAGVAYGTALVLSQPHTTRTKRDVRRAVDGRGDCVPVPSIPEVMMSIGLGGADATGHLPCWCQEFSPNNAVANGQIKEQLCGPWFRVGICGGCDDRPGTVGIDSRSIPSLAREVTHRPAFSASTISTKRSLAASDRTSQAAATSRHRGHNLARSAHRPSRCGRHTVHGPASRCPSRAHDQIGQARIRRRGQRPYTGRQGLGRPWSWGWLLHPDEATGRLKLRPCR